MKTCSLALMSMLLLTTMLSAQDKIRNSGDRQKVFEALDRNGDKRLSRTEVGNNQLFVNMDADGDGFVTLDEARSFAQKRRQQTQNVEATDEPVFPPRAAAVFARKKSLESIEKVVGTGKRPPNIVLILADDLGYGDTTLYGSRKIPTPHINALGKQGVKFNQAYVTAASCSPSRAGLLTGQYQQRFGFEFNTAGGAITHRLHRGLDPAAVTLADVLKKAGYVTGMFGKWHLGTQPHLHPQTRGFDEFYGFLAGAHSFFPAKAEEPLHSTIMRGDSPMIEQEYLTDAIARETVEFIDVYRDEPFFAYVPFNAVHTPIEATKEYQDRFPNEENETRRDYYAMTSALDSAVGAIVGALEKYRLSDNTMVIFLNDNGGPIYSGVQSNGNLRLGKLFLFEGGIRVPMIIKWPGSIAADTVFEKPTSSLDVFPTVCAASGIKLSDSLDLDGTNLLPFLSGKKTGAPHDTLFWSNGPNIAVLKENWKLVKSHDSVWLFDLSKDEGEKTNLAESNPDKIKELEQEYDNWRSEMKSPAWPSKPRRRKVDVDGMVYELNI